MNNNFDKQELAMENIVSFATAIQKVGGHVGVLLQSNSNFFLMLASNGIKVNFEVVKAAK